jgi:hypothetical protein
MVYSTGAYTPTSVGVLGLVKDVLGDAKIGEMHRFNISPELGLLISCTCRGFLTLLG